MKDGAAITIKYFALRLILFTNEGSHAVPYFAGVAQDIAINLCECSRAVAGITNLEDRASR